ncbi:MAG TPA: FlgD immunoglobulin-like domain containing protein [Candidatus Cloacimonadota bacterium]|nr:FlgD immunoglobulin-like domain containing protein [Candidatus Cloacimonadota bacterium]HQL14739.1 FlgD immunoglobulin-like domain containing protein [Candidatus Cloacimonadota bacterium]
MVRKLCQTGMKKGYHKIEWNGKDEKGQEVGSGLYLINLAADGKAVIRKAILLK